MEKEEYEFVYINQILYLLLLSPLIISYLIYLFWIKNYFINSQISLESGLAWIIIIIILFISYIYILNNLIFPLYTFKGKCILNKKYVEFQLKYSKKVLWYIDIKRIGFGNIGKKTKGILLKTNATQYNIEQTNFEKKYGKIHSLQDIYAVIHNKLHII